jgi:hypothetical protein
MVCALLLVAGPIAVALGYDKPAGGKWQIQDVFDYTAGGSMKVAANGKAVKKLKLKVGADYVETCGAKKLSTKGKLKVKKFVKSGGRWAVGRTAGGSTLIEPIKAKFKLGTKTVKGKALMLFDESGETALTARVELDACTLTFAVRKG